MSVKVDRKRKIPVTTLLRALPRVVPEFTAVAKGTDEEILALFEGVDEGSDHHFVQATLDKDPAGNAEEALLEFYRRLRPGDPPNADNARSLLNSLFFNFRRYDLGKVGRYKVNKRLGPADRHHRAHPDPGRPGRDRARDGPHQPRQGHRATTSTTSATAACAPSAS